MPVVTLSYANTKISDISVASTGTPSIQTLASGVDNAGVIYRSYLTFDLGLIPNNVIINSAVLKLYETSGAGSNLNEIRRVTSNWNDTMSWSTQPSVDPNIVAALYSSPNTFISFELKSLVQSWVNGTDNYGLQLKCQVETGTNNFNFFASNENSSTVNRPTLTIDYSIPTTGKKQVEYVGFKATSTATSVTSTPLELPSGIQTGDLLIAQVTKRDTSTVIAGLNGWTALSDRAIPVSSGVSFRYGIYYKFATSSETQPTLTSQTATLWQASVSAYRNAKAVRETVFSNFSTNIPNPPNATTTYDKTMLLVLSSINSFVTAKPYSLNFQKEVEAGSSATSITLFSMAKYMYNEKSIQGTDMKVEFSDTGSGEIRALFLEPINNIPPTLTLASPADNQTLSEGNTMAVQGSASDVDSGNVVTAKYKINNGPVRALQSGVSNGSTPISFAKNLTYRDKRLWDGNTDVIGVDLAENTDHTLTVWAEDDQGGKSSDVIRTFRVIWNRPPVINGSDKNLGTISTIPSESYSVTEPENDTFTITELLNGQEIRSFPGVAGQQYTITIDKDRWLRLPLGVQHELRVRATDSKGQFTDRIFTFIRSETQILFKLKQPFLCDAKPTRVLVTLDGVFPSGSNVKVEVCNNAYDAVPTYEDATGPSLAGRGYIFTNTAKTAANWGINIRITIDKGTATDKVILNGFGGAFD